MKNFAVTNVDTGKKTLVAGVILFSLYEAAYAHTAAGLYKILRHRPGLDADGATKMVSHLQELGLIEISRTGSCRLTAEGIEMLGIWEPAQAQAEGIMQ